MFSFIDDARVRLYPLLEDLKLDRLFSLPLSGLVWREALTIFCMSCYFYQLNFSFRNVQGSLIEGMMFSMKIISYFTC